MRYLLAFLGALFASPAMAATSLRPDAPVCISDELFSQYEQAVLSDDMHALAWLFDNGCAISTAKLPATVLERYDGNFRVHLRVYRGNDTTEVWTLAAAVDGLK